MQLDDPRARLFAGEAGAARHAHGPVRRAQRVRDPCYRERARARRHLLYVTARSARARRIARAIVAPPLEGERCRTTTAEFAQLVAGIVQRRGRRERIHPATRIFQALRIAVNDELDALREGLHGAIGRLRGAGRVVAISFHSLEDRIVKQTLRDDERLDVLTKRPIRAGASTRLRGEPARTQRETSRRAAEGQLTC